MWYIYGLRWIKLTEHTAAARVYKIGHATSADGISWVKEGRQLIPDKLNADECQALPTVTYFNNRYHMFFCYRQAFGFRTDNNSAYRIGYAFSHNMVDWTRDDDSAGIDVSDEG